MTSGDLDLTPDELAALLLALTADERPRPELRNRVLARVASIEEHGTGDVRTIRAPDGEWRECMPGMRAKVLFDDGTRSTWLARLAPRTSVPAHDHDADEECLVLDGTIELDGVVMGPGDYQIARAGSRHEAVHTDTGCVLLMRTMSLPTDTHPR